MRCRIISTFINSIGIMGLIPASDLIISKAPYTESIIYKIKCLMPWY
ncbi:hypothetical protein RBEAN4_0721 [Rickettsia bellii str. RML An4]|uniref:Uncharacterized protein n=1 Tax=Rickettsia bellii str. RML An4 TaxID=1359193 RepID=A0A0F3QB17_RICBE|nr:hypothetical protein RBEAN4_0721 [Rickettsia bellii str. RML An4]